MQFEVKDEAFSLEKSASSELFLEITDVERKVFCLLKIKLLLKHDLEWQHHM